MRKSYINILKEDIAPYLIKRMPIPGSSTRELYTFRVYAHSPDIQMFQGLAKRYQCWIYVGNYIYTYESNSTTMKKIADNWNNRQCGKTKNPCSEVILDQTRGIEPINDITSDHVVDSLKYVGQYVEEYKCEFKQKGNEMNKDKFSAKNKTYITVNGKDFSLTSPFDAEASLGVILELSERLNTLNDNISRLESINSTEDQTDVIAIDKVTSVAISEISSIKEMVDFINDNIEE